MNRRDFLQPRHAASFAAPILGALEPARSPVAPPPSDAALLRLSRRAMATDFEIVLPFDSNAALAHGEAAFDLLDDLEDQLTVYRDHSEVCRLNRTAFAGPVPVEVGLFGLLCEAARITAETDGAFDATAGCAHQSMGLLPGPRRVPSEAERAAALERVGMRWVRVRRRSQTASPFCGRDWKSTWAAIGKGYALDRVGDYLIGTGKFPAVLLHGGQSSVYARGRPNGDPRGWRVGISHPWESGRRLAEVWLRDRALATSAATFQHLEYNGKKLGHILDPRSGWPAEGIASASVLAPTGARSRRPFDGLLRRRRRTGPALLRGASGNRRLAAARRRRRSGDPESRPPGMFASSASL